MLVSPNLYAYLQMMHEDMQSSLRDELDEYWIFIDAICINQDDVPERNRQVALMRQIYHDADLVVAWLGNELDLTLFDLECVKKSEQYSSSMREDLIQRFSELEEPTDQGQPFVDIFYPTGDRPVKRPVEASKSESLFNALVLLSTCFHRDYWSRVWILQEVVSADMLVFRFRRLRVWSGHLQMLAREYFQVCLDNGEDLDKKMKSVLDGDSSFDGLYLSQTDNDGVGWDLVGSAFIASLILSIREMRRQDIFDLSTHHNRHQQSILQTFTDVSQQECTIPFDKVFGILGLVDCQLQPDYNMSSLELVTRVFVEGILEYDQSNALCKKFPPRERSTSAPEFHSSGKERFCFRLLMAMDLDPCSPVVALSIRTAFGLCSMLRNSYHSHTRNSVLMFYHMNVAAKGDPKQRSAWLRMAATIKELDDCISTQKLLKSPCVARDKRTPDQWLKFTIAIFFEVVMQRGAFLKRKLSERLAEFKKVLVDLEDLKKV